MSDLGEVESDSHFLLYRTNFDDLRTCLFDLGVLKLLTLSEKPGKGGLFN